MLPNLLRFLGLIGALVFVHELAHFLVARLFGVKVLKFSLGFGPRLFGWRSGSTDYCVSLVPLGGFLKMLGEEPGDRIAPEDRPRAFHLQKLWKRFAIVLAGPLMSLLFPIVLYGVVYLGHTDLTPPIIGNVVRGYPAETVLIPGDRVTAIDGQTIGSFQEIREIVAEAPGRALRFEVIRDGLPVTARVTPETLQVERPLDAIETVGFLGIAPGFRLPVVGVRGPRSPAGVAGLLSFDMVTMYAGHPIRRGSDLDRALSSSRGATVPLAYLRPRAINNAAGGLVDLEIFDPGLAQITPSPGTGEVTERTGFELPDLVLSDVDPESPEHQMGLRRGARIISVDGVAPPSWERLREQLLRAPSRLRTLRFELDGREAEGAFALRPAAWTDEFGHRMMRLSLGIERWWPTASEAPISNPSPVTHAVRNALRETREVVTFLVTGMVRIFQGRVPISSVGGPILIYDASRSTAPDGLWGFLRLMALVSLNLGLMNLLPIPTLDGGHLLFFAVEGVLRRPAPLWVRQTASVLGLLAVAGVIVLAFRNDLGRKLSEDTRPRVVAPAVR